jgi:hypothetical protein
MEAIDRRTVLTGVAATVAATAVTGAVTAPLRSIHDFPAGTQCWFFQPDAPKGWRQLSDERMFEMLGDGGAILCEKM